LADGATFLGSWRQRAGQPRIWRLPGVAILISGRASVRPFPCRSEGPIARRPEGSISSTPGE